MWFHFIWTVLLELTGVASLQENTRACTKVRTGTSSLFQKRAQANATQDAILEKTSRTSLALDFPWHQLTPIHTGDSISLLDHVQPSLRLGQTGPSIISSALEKAGRCTAQEQGDLWGLWNLESLTKMPLEQGLKAQWPRWSWDGAGRGPLGPRQRRTSSCVATADKSRTGEAGNTAKIPAESRYLVIPSLRHSWKAHFLSALRLRNVGLEDVWITSFVCAEVHVTAQTLPWVCKSKSHFVPSCDNIRLTMDHGPPWIQGETRSRVKQEEFLMCILWTSLNFKGVS